MLLTLSARCIRPLVTPAGRGKKAQLDMLDLPRFARETLGLHGLALSTELLAGADRARLEAIRDRGDRAGCACLLLSEYDGQNFGSTNENVVGAASERTRRVIEAAHILGCSAASVRIEAPDDDAALARVANALRPVVERAEKLDMNLLLAPGKGLTSRPDRVTELLKKVGGFRIGTYPDFEVAAASSDPVQYLQRLTPYATAVCAATISLKEPTPGGASKRKSSPPPPLLSRTPRDDEDDEEADEKPSATKKKAGKKGAKAEEPELPPAEAKGTKAAKGKKGEAPPPPPPPAEEPETEDDEDFEGDDEIEDLIDEVMAAAEDEVAPLVAMDHEPYDLEPLVRAIVNVGYDGPLAIEYRGQGDLVMGITQSRDTLLALIAAARQ